MSHIATSMILEEFQNCSNLDELMSLCEKYPSRLVLTLSVTIDGVRFTPDHSIYLNDQLNFIIED